MEEIIGLRLIAAPTEDNLSFCSRLSAKVMSELVKRRNVLFNQILFPYADALSLSGKPGTQSTRIFGTHMLLRNVTRKLVEEVIQNCFTEEGLILPPEYEIVEFNLTDGAAKAADLAGFLNKGEECSLPGAGNFAGMMSGYLPHWRIRERARVFASFSEMAYRIARGEISGLYGGRLILTPQCRCWDAIESVFVQKTGA